MLKFYNPPKKRMSISIRDGLKKKDSYIFDREINDEKNIAIILDDIHFEEEKTEKKV